mmetsp:Transcript_21617/g.36944  ORF Transcript_21617/g.36944 Transcript_21617/m.36944 type:complete len:222 (-) Transcript_21617:662-1327(-)
MRAHSDYRHAILVTKVSCPDPVLVVVVILTDSDCGHMCCETRCVEDDLIVILVPIRSTAFVPLLLKHHLPERFRVVHSGLTSIVITMAFPCSTAIVGGVHPPRAPHKFDRTWFEDQGRIVARIKIHVVVDPEWETRNRWPCQCESSLRGTVTKQTAHNAPADQTCGQVPASNPVVIRVAFNMDHEPRLRQIIAWTPISVQLIKPGYQRRRSVVAVAVIGRA